MKNKAKRFYSRVALVACVAMSNAAAERQSAGLQDPSDSGATVAPLRYESFLPKKNVAAGDASPADNWKEANRTVASLDAMSVTMTHPDDAGAMKAEPAAPAPATQSDRHAGHMMTPVPASDPHAAHQMPPMDMTRADMHPADKPPAPHAGHKMANKLPAAPARQLKPAPVVPDPHAGHVMPPAVPDPHAGHAHMEKK